MTAKFERPAGVAMAAAFDLELMGLRIISQVRIVDFIIKG
jgi:hypothetical protein